MSLAIKTLLALLVSLLVWRLTAGASYVGREVQALALRQQAMVTAVVDSKREECERDPTSWRQDLGRTIDGSGPALRMFAYDANLVSSNRDAPRIESSWSSRAPIAPGVRRLVRKGEPARYLVAMPWSNGPCAFVLAEDMLEPSAKPPGRPPLFMLVATMVVVAVMVVRLRRLLREIRTWEADAGAGITESVFADEIGVVTRAFRRASAGAARHLARAIRSEEALRNHVADVSHDLMIPLTVLMDRIYRLRSVQGITQEVGEVMQDAQYLSNLVRSIEVAARMDSSETPLSRVPVDLSDLVDRVVARHDTVASHRGVSLRHAVPPKALIEGDALVVEQVVSNLVHNAIAYTPQGGHVAVVVDYQPEGGLVLCIADDGPGVEPEEFESMLTRGARGSDASKRNPLGKGLGLSIVKRAVEAHGWRLRHRALEPNGLEVSLTFGVDAHPLHGPRLSAKCDS